MYYGTIPCITGQYPVLRDSTLYYGTVPLLKDSPCITGQYPVAAWEIAHLATPTWEIAQLGSCPLENANGKVPNTPFSV